MRGLLCGSGSDGGVIIVKWVIWVKTVVVVIFFVTVIIFVIVSTRFIVILQIVVVALIYEKYLFSNRNRLNYFLTCGAQSRDLNPLLVFCKDFTLFLLKVFQCCKFYYYLKYLGFY